MHPEDQELHKLETEREALEAASSKIAGEVRTAEKRVAEIEDQLPDVIIRAAMRKVPVSAPTTLRRKLQELRLSVEGTEEAQELIAKELRELDRKAEMLHRRQTRRREYEELKAEIRANPAVLEKMTKERALLYLCESLYGEGNQEDARAFAAQIRAGKAA